jgi:hypothetical protein
VEFKQTKHQVARGSQPDGETCDALIIIKNVSELRVTYQVRLLAYRAWQEGKRLVIDVPRECRIHSTLQELHRQLPQTIQITRS